MNNFNQPMSIKNYCARQRAVFNILQLYNSYVKRKQYQLMMFLII